MISGHYFKRWKQWQISFSWALNHCRWWLQSWNQKMIASWQESYDKTKLWPRQCVEKHSADKGPYSQGYGLPTGHIQLWELDHKEGRALKNWCFQIVVLKGLLRVPWTARRSNQSILREINPKYSLEGLVLKLQLLYFGHLMWTTNSLEKSLMLEKIEGRRRTGHETLRWLDGITYAINMNLGKLCEMLKDREAWCAAVHGVTRSWTGLSD